MPFSFYIQKNDVLDVRHVRDTFFRFASRVPQNDWKMKAICYMVMSRCFELSRCAL